MTTDPIFSPEEHAELARFEARVIAAAAAAIRGRSAAELSPAQGDALREAFYLATDCNPAEARSLALALALTCRRPPRDLREFGHLARTFLRGYRRAEAAAPAAVPFESWAVPVAEGPPPGDAFPGFRPGDGGEEVSFP